MNLIDTHSHIYQEDYLDDIEQVIANAREHSISRIFMPNVDLESIQPMLDLESKYPGYCIPLMGLHPTSVDNNYQTQLNRIKEELDNRKYCGIGEIGIDLYWSSEFADKQKIVFQTQIEWAKEMQLPVVIHVRNSHRETMAALQEVGTNGLTGVFHSFCGTEEEAKEILNLENFFLGINGIVTFKNSNLKDILKNVPLNRLVLETDAPYLTPAPHRGKRNHPSYLRIIAGKLAEIYDCDVKEVANTTTQNAKQLFPTAFPEM
ncbi:TatD family hydrolase [Parabacteroides sp. FAFU027]|uniref:TatD family hydrolase n=1 Tax=Parabacteroides sp. FAFU027 TaxID=2922715 RepID=UPI001FAFFB10|nr:TatD family hydrolase [Parabacteroides sp. FAFU027]